MCKVILLKCFRMCLSFRLLIKMPASTFWFTMSSKNGKNVYYERSKTGVVHRISKETYDKSTNSKNDNNIPKFWSITADDALGQKHTAYFKHHKNKQWRLSSADFFAGGDDNEEVLKKMQKVIERHHQTADIGEASSHRFNVRDIDNLYSSYIQPTASITKPTSVAYILTQAKQTVVPTNTSSRHDCWKLATLAQKAKFTTFKEYTPGADMYQACLGNDKKCSFALVITEYKKEMHELRQQLYLHCKQILPDMTDSWICGEGADKKSYFLTDAEGYTPMLDSVDKYVTDTDEKKVFSKSVNDKLQNLFLKAMRSGLFMSNGLKLDHNDFILKLATDKKTVVDIRLWDITNASYYGNNSNKPEFTAITLVPNAPVKLFTQAVSEDNKFETEILKLFPIV